MDIMHNKCRCVYSFLFLCIASHSVLAGNTLTPAEQQQILQQDRIFQHQRQREEAIEHRRQLKEQEPRGLKFKQELDKEPLLSDNSCFNIHDIKLNGALHLNAITQKKLKAAYLNKCIGMDFINKLVGDITNYYIDNGYITSRAYIPEQDISDGKLTIEVLEGRVEGFLVNEEENEHSFLKWTVFPFMSGRLLNLRDIEQGLDQINRLPSNKATVKLRPGTNPGDSFVLIDNKSEKKFRLNFGLDNGGQSSTGIMQRSFGLEIDNPIGLNEQFIFNYLEDAAVSSRKDHQNVSGYFSVPFGYWTVSYNGSYFKYNSTLDALNTNFQTSGHSLYHTFGLNRVIHRNANSKSSIDARLTIKETNNFLQGNRIDTSSRRLSIVHLGVNHSHKLLGGVINFNLAYEKGIKAFNAVVDEDDLLPGEPSAQSGKYVSTLSFFRYFNVNNIVMKYSILFRGQFTDDDLFASEQISLGGENSIRGFKDSIALGDSGVYMQNEVSAMFSNVMLPVWLSFLGELDFFMAYDIGKLRRDRADNLEYGGLSGLAFGFRKTRGHFRCSLVLSKPLSSPFYIDEDSYEGYLSLGFHY